MIFSKKKITELEYQIIEKVKSLRQEKRISKMELSTLIGVADSFVGKVESYAHPDKYNFKHLFKIAIALKLTSVKELIPDEIPKYDEIEIIYEMVPKLKKDGTKSKQLESQVLNIRPIKI